MQVDLQRLRSVIRGTGWAKFLAIMYYIAAVGYILGCVTIPFGIITIILGMKLWSAADNLDRLKYSDDPTALYAALDDLGSYFVWSGILVVVGIILTVVSVIAITLYFASYMPSLYDLYSL